LNLFRKPKLDLEESKEKVIELSSSEELNKSQDSDDVVITGIK